MLVTAIHFLLLLMAIFKGRSPKPIFLPTGVIDQPLGNNTRLASSSAIDWANSKLPIEMDVKNTASVQFFIVVVLEMFRLQNITQGIVEIQSNQSFKNIKLLSYQLRPLYIYRLF